MPNLTLQSWGDEVSTLHGNLAQLGLIVPTHEVQEKVFGIGTQKALLNWQEANQLPLSGSLDETTDTALRQALAGALPQQSRVEGRILSEQGQPMLGLALRLYLHSFGGGTHLLTETHSDEQGFYFIPYSLAAGTPANIELRTLDLTGQEMPLTGVKLGAAKRETMNLVAPSSLQAAASEFQRLSGDLSAKLGDFGLIGQAKEGEGQQDLSLLREATGWDARLLALGSKAVQLSASTGIEQQSAYGLLRAGLPAEGSQLASLSLDTVEKALQKTVEAGVVSLSEGEVTAAKEAFQGFAAQFRLQEKAVGGLSSVGDMLAKSGLDANETALFENVYFQNRGSGKKLWDEALAQGLAPEKVDTLRLQGKLAFLTLNNADLGASLQPLVGTADNMAALVSHDFHKAETWVAQLNTIAHNDPATLEKLIPPAYAGESLGERLQAYATDRAQVLRSNYPTQVIARMVETDELKLGDAHEVLKSPVHTFLTNAVSTIPDEKFELGSTPVESFFERNKVKLSQGIEAEQLPAVLEEVKTLHRLYQITPTDTAMKLLKSEGFTSALDVTAYSQADFMRYFGGKFHSQEEATVVYKKAEQASMVVHGLHMMAKQIDSTPPVFALSPTPNEREAAKSRLIKEYPTMERLFGTLDYCECEHCRSVLSPAAYLVDLLQFLDVEPGVWERFLTEWRNTHGGADYGISFMKPFDALIERRPDLQHLPLTCENTHTALPYIDVVNEILEYFIVHEKLSAEAAHDTGSATTPELIAEPQNILPEAYRILSAARYPLHLPFDLWLETSRRFLTHLDLPLWRLMELFRPTDLPSNELGGWRKDGSLAIFAEYLGISPTEHDLFTSADPLATWHELYGYSDRMMAWMMLMVSAKTLSQRLGLSYKELAQLTQCRFINPQMEQLATLHKLGLSPNEVFRYMGHPNHPAMEAAEREALEQRLDALTQAFTPTGSTASFDARAWLNETWAAGDFNEVLVLADPGAGCSFDLTKFQRADGTPASEFEYFKTNVFVRLWRKLGWTMEETDRALTVFLPKTNLPLDPSNFGESMRTALLYMAHLDKLERKLNLGKNARLRLLTCWSDLPTDGKNSLYAQAFLTRSVLKNSPVFDDTMGKYLTQPGILLKDHLAALRPALSLGEADILSILDEAGLNWETAALNLANVSLLYRYGLMAKAVKLLVSDFLALKTLSGIDPFRPLHNGPVVKVSDDAPLSATLAFVEVAETVRESGFSIEELSYLFSHRYDANGKSQPPTEADFLSLMEQMATAFPDEAARIQAVASQKSADAALVATLLGHLHDPQHEGAKLIETFALAEGQPISADWLGSGGVLVDHLRSADILLDKALRFSQGLRLNAREVKHFFLNAKFFAELDWDLLPSSLANATPAASTALFKQFLRLANYARLRDEIAGGSDELIGIFEKARRLHPVEDNPAEAKKALAEELYLAFASLTRRDLALVRAMVKALDLKLSSTKLGDTLRETIAPDFVSEQGLERCWQVLRAAAKTGMPVEALARWANPTPDHDMARELRNTVKASYEPERWQSVAKPIFDKLRQVQRDALVSYILYKQDFARVEELFEYFLIDPGMEPVVQTSRLRLAISSVQLFIQRCLLNLELKVHPAAIVNARHWQWMKRYRVWEANRKIFLFPENWLEPEFRDDKSHLFRELEGTMLQGDVSKDLAEDAFFQYLKKMEELARLEIVTMYIEESTSANILHVVGRTYNQPHRYFYRRFARQMWTPWEPIQADIEGDHVAAVVWRERLHLFWLTFLEKPRQSEAPDGQKNKSLSEVKLGSISEAPTKWVEVQLNWSEYYQGQWTTKEAGGFAQPVREEVPMDFDKSSVSIHVSTPKEGEEESVMVQLHFERVISRSSVSMAIPSGRSAAIGRTARNSSEALILNAMLISGAPQITASSRAFRLYTKNSPPEPTNGAAPPVPPLRAVRSGATQHRASGGLFNAYVQKEVSVDGKTPVTTQVSEAILRSGQSFVLLSAANATLLPNQAVAALSSPFFYMDRRNTFFVEPTLTETTIDTWEEWTVTTPGTAGGSGGGIDPGILDKVPIQPAFPRKWWEEPALPVSPIDPGALYQFGPKADWLTHEATRVSFGDKVVGEQGGLSLADLMKGQSMVQVAASPEVEGNVAAGSNFGAVLPSEFGAISHVLSGQSGILESAVTNGGGLSVVGSSGLNTALLENLNSISAGNLGGLFNLNKGGLFGR